MLFHTEKEMRAAGCICLTGSHGAWSPACPVHGPEPGDAAVTERARSAATAAVVASLLCERLAANLERPVAVRATPKMAGVIVADRKSAATALRDLAAGIGGTEHSSAAVCDAFILERADDAGQVVAIARQWAAWAGRVDP